MRAIEPVAIGHVSRDGIMIGYELYGTGERTLVLLPPWSIIHARSWKAQVHFLARHYRVVVVEGRGNGRSDRPQGAEHYSAQAYVDDAVAIMDELGLRRCVLVGFSFGGHLAVMLAAQQPERVEAAVLIAPSAPFGPANPHRSPASFQAVVDAPQGWWKYNEHYWRSDYSDFVQFFFEQVFPEPHSTKQIEDAVGWAHETSAGVLIDTVKGRFTGAEGDADTYRSIRCPVLVIHGDRDTVVPVEKGRLVAELCRAELVEVEGAGHAPHLRYPAAVNRAIQVFVERVLPGPEQPVRRIRPGLNRARRVLYVSSPIGLGHARRDIAIARELQRLKPDLVIDWLAQHPATTLLAEAGQRVHPASRDLANESAHIESEAGEHGLHIFEALRRMDEIAVANFMVFQELVDDGSYDCVVADEAWEVDHFWHEHPELKRTALAWLTDFVGFLPVPQADERERALTANYNAEMIAHVERFPHVRDRSIFIGWPDDIVPGTFGPGLPEIRAWTERRFDFAGYVLGQDPAAFGSRPRLRQELGYSADETVCIVAVGGSGVGTALLHRAADAHERALSEIPELRTILVCGPRIDPAALPVRERLEARGFVPDLPRHLAACDVAVVQGGLATCMELTAAGTPFVSIPLRNHFEQIHHVDHRLRRYGAGRKLDADMASPEQIAQAIVTLVRTPPRPRPVETDGAARAATMIAEML
jgi:pimeloyl-ACP methyl ester carboxylesterase